MHGTAIHGQQVARPPKFSTIPVASLEFCRDLPCWQSEAVLAATAATKDKQIALDRPASLLLILWCFLGDSPISIEAIQKRGKTQARWTPEGKLGILTPEQVGINDVVASVLTNTKQLETAVQTLLGSGLLNHATSLYDGSSTYTVDTDTRKMIIDSISSGARVLWTTQVLMLVAFTFPRPNISEE